MHRRQFRLDTSVDVDVLPLGQRPGHVALGRHNLGNAEIGKPRIHLAALDFSQIENVVDHFQKRFARLLNVLHITLLLVVQGIDRAQNLAKAKNAVQRRTQLVAHRGQEIALKHVQLVEPHVGLGQFVHFAVQAGIHLPKFFLGRGHVTQHAVEGHRKPLEFVARVNVGPQRSVAAANGVAHIAQMAQRLNDHITHNNVRGHHRGKHGDNGRRKQDRPIPIERPLRGAVRNGHLDDGHQVVFGQRRAGGHIAAQRKARSAKIESTGSHIVAQQTRLLRIDRLEVLVLVVVANQPIAEPLRIVGSRPLGLRLVVAVQHSPLEFVARSTRTIRAVGFQKPPLILLLAQSLGQVLNQRQELLVRLQALPVLDIHHLIDQQATGIPVLPVDHFLGLAAVPPETGGNQQQQTRPEQETAFPLQAGLAEYAFDRTIRHGAILGKQWNVEKRGHGIGPRGQKKQQTTVSLAHTTSPAYP